MRRGIFALAAIGLMSACAPYPKSAIAQGGPPSGLYFANAPGGSRLTVDGADAGDPSVFEGYRRILTVSAGTHRVTITRDNAVLFDQPINVDAGARVKIEVPQ
jgi:hypothetical protein